MEVDLAKEEYIREAVERIDDVSSNAHLYCFFLLKQSVYWCNGQVKQETISGSLS